MARTCTVCRHEKLDEIDQSLLIGAPFRDIAKQFKLSIASLHRHRKHLSQTLRKAHEATQIGRADALADQLKALQQDAHRIKSKAERSRDYRGALAGIRELSRLLQIATNISQTVVGSNGDQTHMTPTQEKLCRHAAHIMAATLHADDRIVLVITEQQADQLAHKLAQIFGVKLPPEEALKKANTGLALRDETEGFLERAGAPDPPIGYRF